MTLAINWSPFLYAHRIVVELGGAGAFDDAAPVSVDAVAKAVGRISGFSHIEILKLNLRETSVKAVTLIYEAAASDPPTKMARIAFSSDLDTRWRRFAVCKELCHILLSENVASRTRGSEEIQSYLEGLLAAPSLEAPDSVATDLYSTLFAIEVLCPFPLREALFDGVRGGRMRIETVAQRCQAPEAVVALAFSEPYHMLARHHMLAQPLPSWIAQSPSFWREPHVDLAVGKAIAPSSASRYGALKARRLERKRVNISSVDLLNQLYDEPSR